jgi:hypothetical protein
MRCWVRLYWVAVITIIGLADVADGEIDACLAQRVSDGVLRVGIVAFGVAAAVWLFGR